MEKYVFGIDIGGTTIKCGLFLESGKLLEKWEIVTDRTNRSENVPRDVAAAIKAKMQEVGIGSNDILGVGIGVPGPVKDDGTVLKCANLGWDILNINDIMTELTGLPVASGNDANVAALGEMWQGGGKGYNSIVMVTLGTGVGGGVILNGKIVAGSRGAAGEIGHIIVNPSETDLCGCGGHGHLEQYASATGIVRIAKKRLAVSNEQSALRKFESVSAKDVFDCAKQGDAVANSIVDEVCKTLAFALSHVAASVDPEAFVIGGGVSKAGTIITERVKEFYNDNILFALSGKDFQLAKLGNDAGIYGCAKMVIDKQIRR